MSLFQSIQLPHSFQEKGYQLSIYRGDLEHANAPGNKWHKLKHNLIHAKQNQARYIASFGGAYSNHLHALSLVCQESQFLPIAIVRGELPIGLNPMLKDFVEAGGLLWPSLRNDYRLGLDSQVKQAVDGAYRDVYWVPEGGSNELGVLGCMEWALHIQRQCYPLKYDSWAISAGSGATSAGFLAANLDTRLSVFPAIKGAQQLIHDIEALALAVNRVTRVNPADYYTQYHLGGYAKLPLALNDFLNNFQALNPEIPLDPIYTSKVLFGIYAEMQSGQWPHKQTLVIHTGGLQGWRGFRDI